MLCERAEGWGEGGTLVCTRQSEDLQRACIPKWMDSIHFNFADRQTDGQIDRLIDGWLTPTPIDGCKILKEPTLSGNLTPA